VMALWTMAFLGSTPIGGPLIGWIGDTSGPRWALALGGVAALIAAAIGARALRNDVGPQTSSHAQGA
jgi:MFS family permease